MKVYLLITMHTYPEFANMISYTQSDFQVDWENPEYPDKEYQELHH